MNTHTDTNTGEGAFTSHNGFVRTDAQHARTAESHTAGRRGEWKGVEESALRVVMAGAAHPTDVTSRPSVYFLVPSGSASRRLTTGWTHTHTESIQRHRRSSKAATVQTEARKWSVKDRQRSHLGSCTRWSSPTGAPKVTPDRAGLPPK